MTPTILKFKKPLPTWAEESTLELSTLIKGTILTAKYPPITNIIYTDSSWWRQMGYWSRSVCHSDKNLSPITGPSDFPPSKYHENNRPRWVQSFWEHWPENLGGLFARYYLLGGKWAATGRLKKYFWFSGHYRSTSMRKRITSDWVESNKYSDF